MEGHKGRTHHSQHPKGGDSPSLEEHIKNKLENMSNCYNPKPMGPAVFRSSQKGIPKPFWQTLSPTPKQRSFHLLGWLKRKEDQGLYEPPPSLSLGLNYVAAPLPASSGWQAWSLACCHL